MKTALLLASLVLSIISCQASPECQWGPSYWCQSKQTAAQCGQETYCKSQVWKMAEKLPVEVKTVQCDVCKMAAQYLLKFVENNATEGEAQAALEKLCSALGSLKDECDTLVDTFFPQIWKELTNTLDPDTVCSVVGLCKSAKLQKVAELPVKVKSVQCDVCKMVVGYLDKYAESNNTEAEAKAALEDFCAVLGSLKDECNTLVDDFFPDIWKMLMNQLDPDTICTEIKLCTSAKLQTVPVKVKSVQCDVCKMVVGYLDKLVENNATEGEAEAALEKLCSALGSLKDECNTLVDDFFPDIWKMLMNQLDPDTICTEIKLCTSAKLQMVPVKVKSVQCDVCKMVVEYLDKYVDSNTTEAEAKAAIERICSALGSLKDECDTLVDDYFAKIWQLLINQTDPDTLCTEIKLCTSEAVAKVQSEVGGLECEACKIVAELMRKYVDENKTEGDVQRELEGFCKILGSLRSECDKLLENFFPQLWDMIVKDLDPATICSELKLCSSQLAKVQEQAVSPVRSMECDYCKIIAIYLNKFMASNGTETEAKDEVKKLCSLLGSEASECNTVVDMFFDQIWKMLVDETEPDVICQLLKLCTNTSALKQPPLSGDVACDICHLVFVFIRPFIDENETEDGIRQFFEESFCYNFFMPAAQNKCVDFFETYFGYIWGKIRNEVDAGLTCKDIGVCTKLPSQPVRSSQNFCKVCELYTSLLRPDFNNKTMGDIKQVLKLGCSDLPSAYRNECASFVEQYFDLIWKLLQGEFEKGLLCKQIGVCPNTASTPIRCKITLPKQNLCDLCKLVVTYLKPFVDSNSTEEEVEQALEQLCNILPSSLKNECTSLIDQNFENIWKLMKSEFNNDLICKQIGLCNSSAVVEVKHAKPKRLSLPKQNVCDLCKLVVTFLQHYVDTNSTEAEVKQAVEQLCNILPSGFKDECNKLIDENFGTIWLLVKSEFNNDLICKQIGLCNSTAVVALPKLPSLKPALTQQSACDMCKLVVTLIKPYVENNSTESEVEAELDELCNLLPGNYSKQCDSLLDDFFPDIWKMLKGELDDDLICEQLKLCNSSSCTKSLSTKRLSASPACDVCKILSHFLKPFADNKTTENETVAAVEKLCSYLPSDYSKTCKNLTDKYVREAWDDLQKDLDSGTMCEDAGICPNKQLVQEMSGPLCILCEFVMKELESMLDSNTTEAEIKAALDKVCSLLPSSIKDDCDGFVNTYGEDIIKLLLEAVSPKVVCTALHLCLGAETSSSVVVMPVVESVEMDDCLLCTTVLGFVKTLVNDYQKPIESALDDVCDLMPSTIKSECSAFVTEFGPAIIQLVDKEINPEQVCKDLKLCKESSLMAPWKKLARAKSF